MNSLVQQYYKVSSDPSKEGFEEVLFLPEEELSFEDLQKLDPYLSKGWYELCHIFQEIRAEFLSDFWLKTLPFEPKLHPILHELFHDFDDIGVFLVKEKGVYRSELVYSLSSNAAFFRGNPPASEESIRAVKSEFESLPPDYLSFFHIHNGFSKNEDQGLLQAEKLGPFYEQFQRTIQDQERVITRNGISIDASLLIPFYERFGLNSYQCFFADWYPRNQIGNVFFSGIDDTISDFTDLEHRNEKMAFETFFEWLVFYVTGKESKE